MTYTDEEVRLATGADDKNDYDPDVLVWAAEQYLKAKLVIEWYASFKQPVEILDEKGEVVFDSGKRAREFLEMNK